MLPRGVTQPIASAKDMVEPIGGPSLDFSFDLLKRLQSSRRRILGAREIEQLTTQNDNPPKRQNTRSGGSSSRRNSARCLQGDFQTPDLSFLRNLASRSDGFNTSSSSGHCKSSFLHDNNDLHLFKLHKMIIQFLAEEASSSSSGLRESPSCLSLDTRINNMSFNAAEGGLEDGECETAMDQDNMSNFEDSIMNYDDPSN